MADREPTTAALRRDEALENLARCVRDYADEMDAPARPNITERYWAMRYALDALDEVGPLIGCRRPSDQQVDYFRRLHGLD